MASSRDGVGPGVGGRRRPAARNVADGVDSDIHPQRLELSDDVLACLPVGVRAGQHRAAVSRVAIDCPELAAVEQVIAETVRVDVHACRWAGDG